MDLVSMHNLSDGLSDDIYSEIYRLLYETGDEVLWCAYVTRWDKKMWGIQYFIMNMEKPPDMTFNWNLTEFEVIEIGRFQEMSKGYISYLSILSYYSSF